MPDLNQESASIVALGSFNPAIFQPYWFGAHNLVRKEEVDVANVEIIHRDVSSFSTEWLRIQVTGFRFAIETADPTMFLPLRDLAAGTFKLLEHTPIRAFGLNKQQHYKVASEEEWHGFGHYFAPNRSWEAVLLNPGLRTLMVEGSRPNCGAKRIRVSIEPSNKIHPGIYINVNQHYAADDDSDAVQAALPLTNFLETLQDSWEEFLTYCDSVSAHLFAEYQAHRQ